MTPQNSVTTLQAVGKKKKNIIKTLWPSMFKNIISFYTVDKIKLKLAFPLRDKSHGGYC